jgi:hypothetical protein
MKHSGKHYRRNFVATVVFGFAWVAALAFGIRTLMSYETLPGAVGVVTKSWPEAVKIPRPAGRPTLVMLAHPQCPCTRASVAELNKIMAQLQGKLSAHVLFLKPQGAPPGWDNSDLRRSAARIPGVTVLSDVDGMEAQKFGAETSGHTFLYDGKGNLLFSGGITQSRGHAGDNAGENAIISLVNNGHAARARSLVFGCSLVERDRKGNRTQCLK